MTDHRRVVNNQNYVDAKRLSFEVTSNTVLNHLVSLITAVDYDGPNAILIFYITS